MVITFHHNDIYTLILPNKYISYHCQLVTICAFEDEVSGNKPTHEHVEIRMLQEMHF